MDAAIPHIPATSTAWSRVPALPASDDAVAGGPAMSPLGPQRREDAAAQLRARLLRMIVDSEHTRKAAATEAFNGR